MKESREKDGAEVELGAEGLRTVKVDVLRQADNALNVLKVVRGIVLGHVLLNELDDRAEEGVGIGKDGDGHCDVPVEKGRDHTEQNGVFYCFAIRMHLALGRFLCRRVKST